MMNDNQKIVLSVATAVAVVAFAVQDYLKVRRTEREVRAKIDADVTAEINAMNRACDIVTEGIRAGKYDKGGFVAAWNDFKFETIIAQIDQ